MTTVLETFEKFNSLEELQLSIALGLVEDGSVIKVKNKIKIYFEKLGLTDTVIKEDHFQIGVIIWFKEANFVLNDNFKFVKL